MEHHPLPSLSSTSKLILPIIIILCSQMTLQAMQNTDIIPSASYYFVYEENPTLTSGYGVTFYSYEQTKNIENRYLSLTEYWTSKWNADQQELFDNKIDPTASIPSITHAKISWHTIGASCGRNIDYYSNDTYITTNHYYGPIDIKKDNLRIDLIKPHSLLSEVQKVEEWDDALPLQGILGFFYPSYRYPYIKKQIIYDKNNAATETITAKHRLIQGIYTAVTLGMVYGAFACITALLKR